MNDINTTGTTTGSSLRYDSSTTGSGTLGDNELHSLQTYVSDMISLEKHIREPIDRQIDMVDTQKYSEASRIIGTIRSLTDSHVSALQSEIERLGGHAASPLKEAWAAFTGQGAKAVDSARKTKVSKNLRDDYTALALASASYTMLAATALGLGDGAVASLAKRHLDDWAPVIIDISRALPTVVLQELRDDGETVAVNAAEEAKQLTQSSWREGSSRSSI